MSNTAAQILKRKPARAALARLRPADVLRGAYVTHCTAAGAIALVDLGFSCYYERDIYILDDMFNQGVGGLCWMYWHATAEQIAEVWRAAGIEPYGPVSKHSNKYI